MTIQVTGSADDLRIEIGAGALVLIGPSAAELPGLPALLEHPCVEGVEAIGARMMDWQTVSAETIEVGRAASQVIRSGRTAVVHLDSHIGEARSVPVADRDFVCVRMGQVMIGLADVPGYVVTHGEAMVHALLVDSLDDVAEPAGSIGADVPLWRLSEANMFAGVPVAMCSGDQPAWSLLNVLSWFESRRA